jgi:hypothetical protein
MSILGVASSRCASSAIQSPSKTNQSSTQQFLGQLQSAIGVPASQADSGSNSEQNNETNDALIRLSNALQSVSKSRKPIDPSVGQQLLSKLQSLGGVITVD